MRSMPAAIKNALNVGSRPYRQSIWDSKPAATISQSPGSINGSVQIILSVSV